MIVFKRMNFWKLVFITVVVGFYFNPVSAQENFVVTVGENKVFTEFNYNSHKFEYDPNNPLPLPAGEYNVDGNVASVAVTSNPGTAGSLHAYKGIQFNWNLGEYTLEQVKDWPINVTVDFSYTISALWVDGFGSANAAMYVSDFNDYRIDIIGNEIGQSGSHSNTIRKTWTTTVGGLEGLNRKIFVEVMAHAHSVSPRCDEYGNCVSQIHYSSAAAQVNSIEIEFLPDLIVESVETVQVIDKADLDGDTIIDLVAGKSSAVFANVKIVNGDLIKGDARNNIYTDLILDGRIIESNKSSVDQLMNNGRIEFYFSPTASNGNVDISVKVDSFRQVPESNESNNINDPPIKVNIKEKKGLFLVYVPINPSKKSNFTPLDEDDTNYMNMVSKSGKFIDATYPISWFSLLPIYDRYEGNPCSRKKVDDCELISIVKDLKGIIDKVDKTGTTYDRIVGVVPAGYFEYHNLSGTKGFWYPEPKFNINKAVIVQEGFWTTPAHEIGHSYGLLKKPEEYDTNPPGNPANGFWVDEKREISNGYCFMGLPAIENSFYGNNFYGNRPVWIDDADYKYLFNNIK